jgi:leader peptidase (prepilin peptidase)/N-methyltransferase
LLAFISSGLGFGDCKLAALIGLVLGWFGWDVLFAGMTTLGFLFAALYLLPRTVLGRIARTDRFAFGPFMLVGAVAVLLVAA